MILAKTEGGLGVGMGGFGSGSWYRWNKKTTVEDSLSIGIGDFRGRIYPRSAGKFTWTWAGDNTASVGYLVTWESGGPRVTLHYRRQDEKDIRVPIRLQTTPTNFDGERWWFTCPLIVGGESCGRRVGKVYLPPGARYFGCRQCHELTYRSCQEAHQAERLLGSIDRMEHWLHSQKSRERVK